MARGVRSAYGVEYVVMPTMVGPEGCPRGRARGHLPRSPVRHDPHSRPSARARSAAWVRSRTPSLARTLVTWFLTVPSDRYRRSAASRLLSPSATARRTSSSRSVSGSSERLRARLVREVGQLAHPGQDLGGDRGLQHGLAAGRGQHGLDEPGRGGVLEQVADGAGAQGREDLVVAVEGRQDEHPHVGMFDAQPLRRRDAVEDGHPQVHEHDVGSQRGDQLQRLRRRPPRRSTTSTSSRTSRSVVSASRNRVWSSTTSTRTGPIGAHPGTSTRTATPVPGVDSTVREPPRRSTRSRMPTRPNPPPSCARRGRTRRRGPPGSPSPAGRPAGSRRRGRSRACARW